MSGYNFNIGIEDALTRIRHEIRRGTLTRVAAEHQARERERGNYVSDREAVRIAAALYQETKVVQEASTGGGADVYRLMMQRPGQRAARVLDARRQTNDWQGKWVVQP